MISVIIPTMWRSPYVIDLLQQLESVDSVGEVILIDNESKKTQDLRSFKKLVHHRNEQNNYVSPSWNQGYELSKYENLCFLNDDIIIPSNVFGLIDSFLGPKIGIVGLLSDVYENMSPSIDHLDRAEQLRLTLATKRNFGYGCCMFMHRDNYRIIPEELKIQYGDDFLFYSCTNNNFVLDGFKIVGKLSGTLYDDDLQLIDKEKVSAICTNDHNFFWEVVAKEILKRTPIGDLDKIKLDALAWYEEKSKTNFYF